MPFAVQTVSRASELDRHNARLIPFKHVMGVAGTKDKGKGDGCAVVPGRTKNTVVYGMNKDTWCKQ